MPLVADKNHLGSRGAVGSADELSNTDDRHGAVLFAGFAHLNLTACEGLKAAKANYAMVGKHYEASIGAITELMDAQTRFTETEAHICQSLADVQTARVKLFFKLGS